MAPIKAVLRSKLDKADTAKSLMELVDKYEVQSDASCDDFSSDVDQAASDSEVDIGGLSPRCERQQTPALPTLFPRPEAANAAAAAATAAAAAAAAAESEVIALQRLQLQLLSQLLFEQLQQQQQQQQQQAMRQPMQPEEQPLNLSFNPLKRPAPRRDLEEADDTSDAESQVKRPCPAVPAATAAAAAPSQRRRKRSYRLSDNEEIRAYQASAPELFAWNGHKPMIHQFLLKLLSNSSCDGLIRWLDRDTRLFKVLQPGAVARLWQFIKGNRTDNYECFARGIRHSRDIGKYFEAHEFRKKKVYKFSEKAFRPPTTVERHQREEQQQLTRPHQPQQSHGHAASWQLQHSDTSQPDELLGSKSSDVLAKLKSALVGRQQQQQQQQRQQQQQQQQQQQSKPEPTMMKEEPIDDESPLVIADCDHL